MVNPTLHYIHDPLCGWCYAAAPLVKAAREAMPVVAHGGGMMAGARRKAVTDAWRTFVMPHDRRIAMLSGQPFGAAYFDGLLRDHGAIFDSAPPTTAVLAAEQLASKGPDLLARLQTAHYVEGRRIADLDVLAELASEIGIEHEPFVAAFARLEGAATEAHFAESHKLLQQVRGNGFPTFALEAEGRLELVPSAPYLGQVQAWRDHLATLISVGAA